MVPATIPDAVLTKSDYDSGLPAARARTRRGPALAGRLGRSDGRWLATSPDGSRPAGDEAVATVKASAATDDGVHYPRWFWPSFAIPGIVWLAVFFLLPMYTVVSVAFGTVDPIFRGPIPVYEPVVVDDRSAFEQVIGRFIGPAAFWQPVLIRTFVFVAASPA